MLLLHISDIHFQEPLCHTGMDPNKPYRTHVIRSVRDRVADLGSVDAILVTGDIAYKGHPSEYEAAFAWLAELAQAAGCTMECVFVVPGNHDVDRDIIRREEEVKNVLEAIANCDLSRKNQELYRQFINSDKALFASISAYNKFAANFGCQVYAPDHLFWQQDIPVDAGERVSLRLFGLTSTILSGMNGNDTKGSLYLSPFQTAYEPHDGIVNVVLCHHPPDWFVDQDKIEDDINDRAAIQLFGHKHRQRVLATSEYIKFSAGAVNPDPNEGSWEPGYNLINISVIEENSGLYLGIEAHLMNWQNSPGSFHPRRTAYGESVIRHRIPVLGAGQAKPQNIRPIQTVQPEPRVQLAEPPTIDVEAKMGNSKTRQLILRFWQLSSSQRREIARGLELISEEEISLPEPERYGRAFIQAGEQGLWDRLEQEIQRMEGQ